MSKLKEDIDDENEDGGKCLVFVYYGGRCVVINGKVNTVQGVAEGQKKSCFDIESWIKNLDDQAFVVGLFDCCRSQE